MKISVEISENDLKDVIRFSGEKKKGPAISKFIASELMLLRRRELSNPVLSGKVRLDFSSGESRQKMDRIVSWQK
jgi:hypothetical protein